MKRFLRRAFNLSAAASAVLCAGCCIALVLKGRPHVLWSRVGEDGRAAFVIADGSALRVTRQRVWPGEPDLHCESSQPGRFTVSARYFAEVQTTRMTEEFGRVRDITVAPDGHRVQLDLVVKPEPQSARAGFEWTRRACALASFSATYETAAVPFWCLTLLTAPLPLLAVWRRGAGRRRARLAARSMCPSCGYDLRATPDRCPECGAVPTVTPKAPPQ